MSLKKKNPHFHSFTISFLLCFSPLYPFSILYRSHLCLFVTLAQEQRDRLLFTGKPTDKWSLTGTNY